jgi:hypothetical protein
MPQHMPPPHGCCLDGFTAKGRFAAYALHGRKLQGGRMFRRLKTALVDSYVGAIALGYLLAEGTEHIINVFTAPFSEWVALKELHRITPQSVSEPGLSIRSSLPHLVHGFFYVFIGLALLHWLYYPAKVKVPKEPKSEADAP